jgi:hypothetical protein
MNGSVKAIVALVLLGAFLVVFGIVMLNDASQKRMEAIPINFDTLDLESLDHGDKVSIEGEVSLGIGISCGYDCGMCAESSRSCCKLELDSPNSKDMVASLLVDDTTTAEPNHFSLPSNFQVEDFTWYTDDGQALAWNVPVRITGRWEDLVYPFLGSTLVEICVQKVEAVK